MEEIMTKLGETVSVGYIITVILFSYLLIRLWFNAATSGIKKLLTVGTGIFVGALYLITGIDGLHALIPSFAIAVVLYDYIIKYLLNKLKAGYKVKNN
jgi:heme/copper-type cytochrome/quinol oxidase subunit 3